jgi:hypothetical protein
LYVVMIDEIDHLPSAVVVALVGKHFCC